MRLLRRSSRRKTSSNRCSTDWSSRKARETQRKAWD